MFFSRLLKLCLSQIPLFDNDTGHKMRVAKARGHSLLFLLLFLVSAFLYYYNYIFQLHNPFGKQKKTDASLWCNVRKQNFVQSL